jgi:hypothetical protein
MSELIERLSADDPEKFVLRRVTTGQGDPNVQAAIEASEKFILEHPDVPTVDVLPVESEE